jgi:SpoVK/Ycf46/Vps4 family AAA+-type ATPase
MRYHIKSDELVRQAIIDAAYKARTKKSAMIFVGPTLELPAELYNVVTYCEFPLPTVRQIYKQYEELVAVYAEDIVGLPKNKKRRAELIQQAATAAAGLDTLSAENALALSLAITGTIDPFLIQAQKEQEVRKSDVLEFVPITEGLEAVGGFRELKSWMDKRQLAFTDKAREYGLPYPKGILMIGVPGSGKSHCAKGVAAYLKLPLLRLDFSKIYRSLVGESELSLNRALKVAEAVAPCVLLVDELDKSLAGHESSGKLDSGVTARVISILLTWRQETKHPIFMIGTANNPEALPSMVYRRGRIDEIWAVDIPNGEERKEIYEIHLRKRGRDPLKFSLDMLAAASSGFTGAEIEGTIEDAMFNAFSDNKEVTTGHILQSIKNTIPQNVRDAEELERLRNWTKNRARSVSGGRDEKTTNQI